MSVEINATNFPDEEFRRLVTTLYDRNHDGVLSDTEIENAKSLAWNDAIVRDYSGIASLQGIEFLTALETIEIYSNANIESIDLSHANNLNSLYLANLSDSFMELNLLACSHLAYLTIKISGLTELDLSNNTELVDIYLNTINMPSLVVGNKPVLRVLDININGLMGDYRPPGATYGTVLASLDIGRCPKLEYLGVAYQHGLSGVNIAECPKLTCLVAEYSGLTSLNISRNAELKAMYTTVTPDYVSAGSNSWYRYKSPKDSTNDGNWYGRYYMRIPVSTEVIIDPISITQQPTAQTAVEGENVIFSVGVSGENLSYQWQIKLQNSNVWETLENGSGSSVTVATTSARNRALIRCYVTSLSGGYEYSKYSNSALLIVISTPVITSSPADISLDLGESGSLTAVVTGESLSYQWQLSTDYGENYSDIEGETDASLEITASALSMNGYKYRCEITNDAGTAYTDPAVLTVGEDVRTVNPVALSLLEGESGAFSVNAKSSDISYQWQYSTDGLTWADLRNSDRPRYEILASISLNGYRYRCVVTNSVGSVTSLAGTLTVIEDTSVTAPVISVNPVNATVDEGQTATFTVAAEGDNLSYQWQVQKDGGWQSIQGATGTSYNVVGTRRLNGSKYRCLVANAAGAVYSLDAMLTVNQQSYISTPRILTQPRSATVALGSTVSFIVRADGGELSYQWQRLNGGQWYDLTGQTASACILMATSDLDGTQYRCAVSNTAGTTYTNIVLLSLTDGPIVNFYGYHSIIISGKNTYGEWEMYPTSRPHIAPPEVKTSYVDLPGADGGIDYTDLLTGEPRYGYRKGSWEFLLIPQEKWASVYRSLVSFLHGKVHTVILEDDPNYVYTGRLSVNEWQSAAHNSLITIDYILEPFPKNISGEDPSESDDEVLNAAERLLRKPENAGMVIGIVNNTASIIDPAILFPDGDSIAY